MKYTTNFINVHVGKKYIFQSGKVIYNLLILNICFKSVDRFFVKVK